MNRLDTSISLIPSNSVPSIPSPLPAVGLVEWSVLSALAVYLIKSGWKHFSDSDQKDRDADRALIASLIEDLRESKQHQSDAQLAAILALRDDLKEIKACISKHSI